MVGPIAGHIVHQSSKGVRHPIAKLPRRWNLALLLLLFPSVIASSALAVVPSPLENSAAREWLSGAFGNGHLPFSFIYGGRHSGELLANWKSTDATDDGDGQRRRRLSYTDPATGLEVTCTITQFHNLPAAEWVVYLKNTGDKDTPIVSNLLPLDANFLRAARGQSFGLRYALGSHERSDDFRMFETRSFSPAETLTFTSFGGRSSDGYLPFFNLMDASGGVMFGIGWTGQWTASFRHAENRRMNVRAGMEYTHLKLRPGEEIRTPAILVVFWNGADAIRGHNLLRTVLREHYTPRPGGKPLQVPLAISAHGTVPFEGTTEANMLAAIESAAELDIPFDTWWIDTGWFELIDHNWARSVGNVRPDPERFPNGIRPIADAAHRNDMKFLLWFELERVMPDTWLFKQHKSWLKQPPSDLPYELAYMYYDGFHLFDLGNPAARKWVTEYTIRVIDEMGLDIYRQDFNMYPAYYWRHNEAQDRQGINEIRYVMGLYQFLDDLRERYPDLLIDNCASGGRRIDFEMLRRSVVLFRSDVAFRTPVASQCMTYALSHWIPYHGLGAVTADPYDFRSGMTATFVVAANLNRGNEMWAELKRLTSQYLEFRHCYVGDFYPLSEYELGTDSILAWQFDRPDSREGLIQLFRRTACDSDQKTIRLQGLVATDEYLVTDVDHPDMRRRMTGKQLMNEGLRVALPERPQAVVLRYRQTESIGQTAPRKAAILCGDRNETQINFMLEPP